MVMSGNEGPAEIMVTEFSHRMADTLCEEVDRGESVAFETLEAMGTPEVTDVLIALALPLAAEARRRYRVARYLPRANLNDPGHLLAITVLQYVYARDADGVQVAVHTSGSGCDAARFFIRWRRALREGRLDL